MYILSLIADLITITLFLVSLFKYTYNYFKDKKQ